MDKWGSYNLLIFYRGTWGVKISLHLIPIPILIVLTFKFHMELLGGLADTYH